MYVIFVVCVDGVDVKWSDKMNTEIFVVPESNVRLDKTCLGQNPQRLFIYRSRFTTSTPPGVPTESELGGGGAHHSDCTLLPRP